MMDIKEIEAAIESILFAAGEPVELDRICETLEIDKDTTESVMKRLADYYSFERRGIRLIKLGTAYQLCSDPQYAELIKKAAQVRAPAALSPSALETLAIIAYFQPSTKAYIDQIRGVDCSYTVSLLVERGLIEECGRMMVPGRPIIYRTTKTFLRAFGLSSLEDLPKLPGIDSGEQISILSAPAG